MGQYCCNCASPVGDEAKTHPIRVTDATGRGQVEVWCPRCFVFHRMGLEPERFNASCTQAVRCQFCGWVTVCFSVDATMSCTCSHCGGHGAIPIRPTAEDMNQMFQVVRDAAEDKRSLRSSKSK